MIFPKLPRWLDGAAIVCGVTILLGMALMMFAEEFAASGFARFLEDGEIFTLGVVLFYLGLHHTIRLRRDWIVDTRRDRRLRRVVDAWKVTRWIALPPDKGHEHGGIRRLSLSVDHFHELQDAVVDLDEGQS